MSTARVYRTCPFCGYHPATVDRSCPGKGCGELVPPAPPEVDCPKCAASNVEPGKFCHQCGARVPGKAGRSATAAAPKKKPALPKVNFGKTAAEKAAEAKRLHELAQPQSKPKPKPKARPPRVGDTKDRVKFKCASCGCPLHRLRSEVNILPCPKCFEVKPCQDATKIKSGVSSPSKTIADAAAAAAGAASSSSSRGVKKAARRGGGGGASSSSKPAPKSAQIVFACKKCGFRLKRTVATIKSPCAKCQEDEPCGDPEKVLAAAAARAGAKQKKAKEGSARGAGGGGPAPKENEKSGSRNRGAPKASASGKFKFVCAKCGFHAMRLRADKAKVCPKCQFAPA